MSKRSICNVYLLARLLNLTKNKASKPIQDTPRMALRDDLKGLFFYIGNGIPLP